MSHLDLARCVGHAAAPGPPARHLHRGVLPRPRMSSARPCRPALVHRGVPRPRLVGDAPVDRRPRRAALTAALPPGIDVVAAARLRGHHVAAGGRHGLDHLGADPPVDREAGDGRARPRAARRPRPASARTGRARSGDLATCVLDLGPRLRPRTAAGPARPRGDPRAGVSPSIDVTASALDAADRSPVHVMGFRARDDARGAPASARSAQSMGTSIGSATVTAPHGLGHGVPPEHQEDHPWLVSFATTETTHTRSGRGPCP